ncbi:alkyl hydroperoxide reductase AhpD [Amylibacter ulvae]|uniref:Alkyl hydroperoxide reductase AhpD n=1 Tax=Paramylibacter ulvae TaxID=1651968 RepID=A0ABQ3D7B2_9RHOB|nr:peroxidase-related enzyme [Amylibacter ulvae]GHA56519.1 alkyl hydroperoxide reductase AhpD [Amylibacter ulvae]
MSQKSISRFPVPEIKDMPDDIKQRVLAVQEKAGFVPNVFLALAHRPDEFRAFFAYHDALMEKDSGLSQAEREMIIVATSNVNGCLYCVVAHGAVLRIRAKNALIADQVAVNYRKADISPREHAMLDFAMKVCNNSAEVSDKDYKTLGEHGFSKEDVWDIAAITAFFGLSNRMVNTIAMRPNDEFFGMAREF